MDDIYNYFDSDIETNYIEDITNTIPFDGLDVSMFKSICFDNNDKENYYYAERIIINRRSGFKIGRKKSNEYKLIGFETNVDDPRLICYRNKIYIMFNCPSVFPNSERCMGISEFDNWSPIFLSIKDIPPNRTEKNWSPFIKDDIFFILYNHDPLVILSYDFNPEGICNIIFTQDNINLPIDTDNNNLLRGGTNLIPYNNYYISASHDRLFYKGRYNHFTRIVLLDAENWKIVYVSKPIIYNYEFDDLIRIDNTNILYDYCEDCYHTKMFLVQYPTSIAHKNEKIFYLTMFVSEKKSLLYEMKVNIDENEYKFDYKIGDINKKVQEEIMQIVDKYN